MDAATFLSLIKEQMQGKLISRWPSLSWHQHANCFQFFPSLSSRSPVLCSYQGLASVWVKEAETFPSLPVGAVLSSGCFRATKISSLLSISRVGTEEWMLLPEMGNFWLSSARQGQTGICSEYPEEWIIMKHRHASFQPHLALLWSNTILAKQTRHWGWDGFDWKKSPAISSHFSLCLTKQPQLSALVSSSMKWH